MNKINISKYIVMNKKKVLILQFEKQMPDLSSNGPTHGTTKCGIELFKYLNNFDEYNVSYWGGVNAPTGQEDFCNNFYDIVVFNHIIFSELVSIVYYSLKKINNNIKTIFISHCANYSDVPHMDVIYNEFDCIVSVGIESYNYNNWNISDQSKHFMIYNPVDVSLYENLDFSKERQNKITVICNLSRSKIDYFIENILQLVKEQIPDVVINLCSPGYNIENINYIADKYADGNSIRKMLLLNKDKLIDELCTSKCVFSFTNMAENLPYSLIEASLCKNIILVDYNYGGVKNVSSDYYKTKFKAPLLEDHELFAKYVIDKLKNYDKYETDLEYERKYVLTKFRSENVLPLWKKIFDEL